MSTDRALVPKTLMPGPLKMELGSYIGLDSVVSSQTISLYKKA